MSDMPNTMSEMVISSSVYVLSNLPQLFRLEVPPVSYDMLFKDPHDGCARYEDVWGG